MNSKEFAIFASAMKTYYPRESLFPNDQSMELWFKQLSDIDFKTAEAILDKWVNTNPWSPTIADIRKGFSEATVEINDWYAEWENVMTAVRKFGSYHPKEAMESLTGITRQCVQSIGFNNICMNEETRFRREFKEMYEAYSQRARQDAQISENIKQQISGVAERLQIGANND